MFSWPDDVRMGVWVRHASSDSGTLLGIMVQDRLLEEYAPHGEWMRMAPG